MINDKKIAPLQAKAIHLNQKQNTAYIPILQLQIDSDNQQITDKTLPMIMKEILRNEEDLNEDAEINIDLLAKKILQKGCMTLTTANLRSLISLDLDHNNIRDKGCQQLTKGNWPKLLHIYLSSNNISEKGCSHLVKAQWSKLKRLYINNNPIGRYGYQLILSKYPQGVEIQCDFKYRKNR